MPAIAMQSESVWLSTTNYNVASMNGKLAARVPELKHALQAGIPAFPDASRDNFYDVELPSGWAYIHVRNDNQTVYLVAYSRL
jgi:hypothetical protein